MDNQTVIKDFHIFTFSIYTEKQFLLAVVFMFLYMTGVSGNVVIITVLCLDTHLHTPMYLFLGNLSFIDICYTTVTLPKLIDMLITGNNSITFIQCMIQTYFFIFLASTEVMLLSSMAYDRYIAICNPLHYLFIMNKNIIALLLGATWISGLVNSFINIVFALNVHFCHPNKINQFFCDIKALAKISCVPTKLSLILFIESFVFVLSPFLSIIVSYVKIIHSVLSIKSMDSRRKAFSTCSSHLTVLTIFYGTALSVYMRSPSEHLQSLDQVLTVLYTAVTPMLNPLIYTLQNREVKCALIRIMSVKTNPTLRN